jgi:cytochrome c551
VALFVLVSLAVYGLARWQPFEPGAPSAAASAGGDADRGASVFANSCAGCHGAEGAGGGVGPKLAGAGLGAAEVAAVVAAGRGIMPAGVVQGAEAADVAAYVARISGGEAPAATAPSSTTTPPPVAAGASGRALLTPPRLSGLRVELDAPTPADWAVWLDGPAGRTRVGMLPAGARSVEGPAADGGRTLAGRYDRVLVGASAESPAAAGSLAPGRADDLRTLLVDDPGAPGRGSVLDAAAGQVEILGEHVRFLAAARDEGNLANVRFHGEHMVNITRGEPVQDVDGNGDPSNPGDGVGLIDGPGAYLPRIARLAGQPAVNGDDRAASALATLIARRGLEAGGSTSVAGAESAIAAIEHADARLARAWTRLRTRAEASAVIGLEPQ